MKKENEKLVVALDAMGCDKGVRVVIRAADIVAKKNKTVQFLIYGNKSLINVQLRKYKTLQNRVRVIHTDRVIKADEKASAVLRTGRDSSMGQAFKAVKTGEAHCAVSAGNTGALMALSMFTLRLIKGVSRPALCTSIPTQNAPCSILDLGANISANSKNLVQFSIMGSLFYTIRHKTAQPSVGILNVGSEDTKGHPELHQTANILSNHQLVNYHGFVEGDDITKGTTNVVVTDGFSGNIALKTLEGTARLISVTLKKLMFGSFIGMLSIVFGFPVFLNLRKRLDPSRYNGAIMLGLNGIAVKSHGSTDHIGFSNAIKVAINLAEQDFIASLHQALEKTNALEYEDIS